jgi:hypothetical protein
VGNLLDKEKRRYKKALEGSRRLTQTLSEKTALMRNRNPRRVSNQEREARMIENKFRVGADNFQDGNIRFIHT